MKKFALVLAVAMMLTALLCGCSSNSSPESVAVAYMKAQGNADFDGYKKTAVSYNSDALEILDDDFDIDDFEDELDDLLDDMDDMKEQRDELYEYFDFDLEVKRDADIYEDGDDEYDEYLLRYSQYENIDEAEAFAEVKVSATLVYCLAGDDDEDEQTNSVTVTCIQLDGKWYVLK